MLAYNSTVHEATGECPCSVQLGRLLNLPLDVMVAPHPEMHYTYASDCVRGTEKRIQDTFRTIRDRLGKTAKRNKRYYDRKHHLNCYRRGDLVLIKTSVRTVGKSPKIQDRYEGPFVVVDKLSDVSYRVQAGPNKRAKIIHHDILKPYAPRYPEENDTSWLDHQDRPAPTLLEPSVPNPEEVGNGDESTTEEMSEGPSMGLTNEPVNGASNYERANTRELEPSEEMERQKPRETGRAQRKKRPPARLADYVRNDDF